MGKKNLEQETITPVKKNKIITITFNDELLNKYTEEYFKLHKRATNKPIKSPLHPSINEWFILPRMQMNSLKQKWKDFTSWVIKYYKLENLKIEKCKITYKFYYVTRARHDNDNMTPKFTNDGLVESGILIDDDYKHVNPLILEGYYDKENPRMEIVIERLDIK